MQIIDRVRSPNGVMTKYLQRLSDGPVVETSYIRQERKHIICASTQVGCPIGCQFCASGLRAQGKRFVRSLSAQEIVQQCTNVLSEIDFTKHKRPLLFSLMGEGEPFLNFGACVEAMRMLPMFSWPIPTGLAISTSGIWPHLIERLADCKFGAPLKLQVSLQAPDNHVRRGMILVAKPVEQIVAAVRKYRETSKGPVDLMYVLCAGINDDLHYAHELVELLGAGWHVKFNRLNLTPGTPYQASSSEQLAKFRAILEKGGITTEYYETNEGDIEGGCGQLSYHFDKQETPHRK